MPESKPLGFKDPKSGNTRIVFDLGGKLFAVVKTFEGLPVKTVKLWTGSSIAKTARYWNTNEPYTVSAPEASAAWDIVTELTRAVREA